MIVTPKRWHAPRTAASHLERRIHDRITHYDVCLNLGECGEYRATEQSIGRAIIRAVQFNRHSPGFERAKVRGITDEGESVPIPYD